MIGGTINHNDTYPVKLLDAFCFKCNRKVESDYCEVCGLIPQYMEIFEKLYCLECGLRYDIREYSFCPDCALWEK